MADGHRHLDHVRELLGHLRVHGGGVRSGSELIRVLEQLLLETQNSAAQHVERVMREVDGEPSFAEDPDHRLEILRTSRGSGSFVTR